MRDAFARVTAAWRELGARASLGLFRELVHRGLVEYMDKMEETNFLVKADPCVFDIEGSAEEPIKRDYTHSVIHAMLQYSELSTSMVFLDRSPTPRATYQSNMSEASIGVAGLDTGYRASSARLLNPSRPMVAPFTDAILGLERVPCVQNVVVAIMPLRFNEEDAVVISEEAAQLGFGLYESVRTYQETIQGPAVGPRTQKFGRPSGGAYNRRHANYSKLDEDGFVRVGDTVSEHDVVIGRQTLEYPMAKASSEDALGAAHPKEVDTSVLARRFEHEALCESVHVCALANKKVQALVRTNKLWTPQIGDKFSSRHGQKGVVGAIVPAADMPFCARTGMRPALLMNSLAFPSRMTIGHLEEVFMGKCAALTGRFGDGTPHHPIDEAGLREALEAYGFRASGKETMVSGVTGDVIEAEIFVGVQSYQRLKQVVHDKEQARARGPRNLKTRQPVEGRSYEGGMRLGEMERDCIISHGAASTLQERLLFASDHYVATVCKQCGMLADSAYRPSLNVANADDSAKQRLAQSTMRARRAFCRECQSGKHIRMVRMPYIFKVVLQETMCMGLRLRLVLRDSENERGKESLYEEPMAPSIGMKHER